MRSTLASGVLLSSLVLLLSACEGSFISVGDRWHTPRIKEAYEARDACFARVATIECAQFDDATAAARVVAQDCSAETEKLVAISNRDGDAKVATNIREDSAFRAMRYVIRARDQTYGGRATVQSPTPMTSVR
jgi:hypothetical protein